VTGINAFSDWTLGNPAAISPTAVRLRGFSAATTPDGEVALQWQTGYEVDNLGYHIYREQHGKRKRVTPSIIAGSALLTGERTALTAGQTYTWFDTPVATVKGIGPVSYWLEDVDINGKRTMHGPIVPVGKTDAKVSKQRRAILLSQLNSTGRTTGLYQAGGPTILSGQASAIVGPRSSGPDPFQVQQQIESMPGGVKLSLKQDGWYRIAQPELVAAGLDAGTNASLLQLYVNGREVPLYLTGDGQHLKAADSIQFYGHGLESPTADAQSYFLAIGNRPGKRILRFEEKDQIALPVPTGESPQNFDYNVQLKERTVYFAALDNGDEENFFGKIINTTPATESISLQHLDSASTQDAQLDVTLQGVSANSHEVQVQVNGTEVGVMTFKGREHPSQTLSVPVSLLHDGTNTVQFVSAGDDTDLSVFDNLHLTYAHAFSADADALSFPVASEAPVNVDGFSSANIHFVDATDPGNMFEVIPSVHPQPDGTYSAVLQVAGASMRHPHTLVAYVDGQGLQASGVTKNNASSWQWQDGGADLLIISHHDLLESAQPLAELRRSQGLSVDLIDVEDLYDEFSYGAHDPQAIRDFINTATGSWKRIPRYVLFVGDATFDPKNYLGQGNFDMVPTRMIYASTLETASDDWFVDMDGDGVPELAIGRLPARNVQDAAVIVNKIVNYVPGQTTQGALLVADHDTGYDFEGQSQTVQGLLPQGMPVQVVNRGTQGAATVRGQIINGIDQGPLLVNYYGHGSVGVWTGAGLLTTSDASSLTNGSRLPVFTLMTCLNGYFQDVYQDSLAEALMKASQGGAVAVWGSSGLTESASQAQMNQEMYRQLFNGQALTVGDAIKGAKVATPDMNVRKTWIFFGDPTMRLR
jgi:hypothetical protein